VEEVGAELDRPLKRPVPAAPSYTNQKHTGQGPPGKVASNDGLLGES